MPEAQFAGQGGQDHGGMDDTLEEEGEGEGQEEGNDRESGNEESDGGELEKEVCACVCGACVRACVRVCVRAYYICCRDTYVRIYCVLSAPHNHYCRCLFGMQLV